MKEGQKGFNHEKTNGKDEWLTPQYIVQALGEFDLDPCSPINRPWNTAKKHYTVLDNGLVQPWEGRVWMNPPYGNQTTLWMQKMAEHNNGIALIFARTETKSYFPWVWNYGHSFMFLQGRLSFHHVDGTKGDTAGSPSVLIAYGANNTEALKRSGLKGKILYNTL